MLYMFRTMLVHHQEQPFISCTSHLVYAGKSGCRVAIAAQQPDVSAYTGIYQMRCTAYKVGLNDGLTESETCRTCNGK